MGLPNFDLSHLGDSIYGAGNNYKDSKGNGVYIPKVRGRPDEIANKYGGIDKYLASQDYQQDLAYENRPGQGHADDDDNSVLGGIKKIASQVSNGVNNATSQATNGAIQAATNPVPMANNLIEHNQNLSGLYDPLSMGSGGRYSSAQALNDSKNAVDKNPALNMAFDPLAQATGNKLNSRSVASGVENFAKEPGKNIQTAGNNIKGLLGSAAYAAPLVGGAQALPVGAAVLGADYANAGDNINSAKNAENDARGQADRTAAQAEALRQGQIKFANQLATNAGRDQGLLNDQAAGSVKRQVSQQMQQAKENSLHHGGTSSGNEQYSQAQAQASGQANLADFQQQTQAASMQQVQDAQNLSTQLGQQTAGIQSNQADQYYQMAIQNMNQRNSAMQGLLQGIGQVGGQAYAAASNPYRSTDPYNPTGNGLDPYAGQYEDNSGLGEIKNSSSTKRY